MWRHTDRRKSKVESHVGPGGLLHVLARARMRRLRRLRAWVAHLRGHGRHPWASLLHRPAKQTIQNLGSRSLRLCVFLPAASPPLGCTRSQRAVLERARGQPAGADIPGCICCCPPCCWWPCGGWPCICMPCICMPIPILPFTENTLCRVSADFFVIRNVR